MTTPTRPLPPPPTAQRIPKPLAEVATAEQLAAADATMARQLAKLERRYAKPTVKRVGEPKRAEPTTAWKAGQ